MQFNHLHFEWRGPTENQSIGYFDYFIDFKPIDEWVAGAGLNPAFYDECNGVICGDGNPYDEAFILRMLGKEINSPEIQAIVEESGYDYTHGLYFIHSETGEICTPIYVSSCCRDIGCGGWVIRIDVHEDRAVWKFGGDQPMGPFVFELEEYKRAFDDLRKQIAVRIENLKNQKTTLNQ